MANRHLARSIALQSLYEWDFGGRRNEKTDEIVAHAAEEFAPALDAGFAKQLVKGVVARQRQLDRVIEKAAPEWPIDQITLVDRNILRLGLWELLFGNKDEVPPKVAINEAIELAKTFGSHSSGRFVNGVLGTVYRELNVDESKITNQESGGVVEELAGAVVFRKENGGIVWAVVKDAFGYWTFAKGHIQPEESAEQAAVRETQEELGLHGTIIEPLGAISYQAKEDSRSIIRKVAYYLVETIDEALALEESGGLKEARWVKPEEFKTLKHYENQEEIVEKAITLLKSQFPNPNVK